MIDIVEKMQNIDDLSYIEGCSEKQIKRAQKALGIVFPSDFIKYVKMFGCIDFGATEWTGLNIKGRLNTVEATKKERQKNKNFPKGFFVLENLGIDGKKVIVNEKGEVSIIQYDSITPLCNSIIEYLDLFIENNK